MELKTWENLEEHIELRDGGDIYEGIYNIAIMYDNDLLINELLNYINKDMAIDFLQTFCRNYDIDIHELLGGGEHDY